MVFRYNPNAVGLALQASISSKKMKTSRIVKKVYSIFTLRSIPKHN